MSDQAESDNRPRLEPVPANIERRIRQARDREREAQAKALGQFMRPVLERITELEKRLEAMPEPALPTLKGLDQAGLGRLATLEHRFSELEKRGVHYVGIWKPDRAYRVGEMVTRQGSIWSCVEPASPGERPGEGLPWRLSVKAGRDGKCRCNRGDNRDE